MSAFSGFLLGVGVTASALLLLVIGAWCGFRLAKMNIVKE